MRQSITLEDMASWLFLNRANTNFVPSMATFGQERDYFSDAKKLHFLLVRRSKASFRRFVNSS